MLRKRRRRRRASVRRLRTARPWLTSCVLRLLHWRVQPLRCDRAAPPRSVLRLPPSMSATRRGVTAAPHGAPWLRRDATAMLPTQLLLQKLPTPMPRSAD